MLLIASEAEAEMGNYNEATHYFNQLRQRAGLPELTLNSNNYVDLILQERFIELSFEGPHRWFDLRRRGLASEHLPGYLSCNDVWPFPQREIDTNPNLVQNDCCSCL